MDISLIKSLLGDDKHYREFIACESDEKFMDYEEIKHDDEWAKKELKKCLEIALGTVLQNYSKMECDEYQ